MPGIMLIKQWVTLALASLGAICLWRGSDGHALPRVVRFSGAPQGEEYRRQDSEDDYMLSVHSASTIDEMTAHYWAAAAVVLAFTFGVPCFAF